MKKRIDLSIKCVVVTTGISSVVTQLLVIREFLTQFCGNEFVIALIFFNWMLLSGIGTLVSSLVRKRIFYAGIKRLAVLSIVLASLSPLQLIAIRIFRDIFFIHGSSTGFYPTLAYTFFMIAPYSLLLGFVLPYSLFTARTFMPDYPGTRIYITDNIGDIAGGVLFSFFLVYICTPFQALFVANLPLLAAAFFLFPRDMRYKGVAPVFVAFSFIILASGILLEQKTLAPKEGELVHYCESRYGRIEIHKDNNQFTLFKDGTPLFSNQNRTLAEEIIHYPLSQIPKVRNLLLISAEGGIMSEIEKYNPVSVDYVEIDPEITKVEFKFGLIKKIKGLYVIHQDGRAYLKKNRKKYDAVIINLPEPATFQVNRFYTSRFFALVKENLVANGILSFSVEGFDNYLAESQLQKISSLYNTVVGHFNHTLLLPGRRVFFLCSDSAVTMDIPAKLRQKGIYTSYITSVILLPFFGILWTAAGLIVIKFLSLITTSLLNTDIF